MFRWLIVVFLALLLIQGITPWLQKLGFGRLPGDLRFRLFGREIFLPLTTSWDCCLAPLRAACYAW